MNQKRSALALAGQALAAARAERNADPVTNRYRVAAQRGCLAMSGGVREIRRAPALRGPRALPSCRRR